MTVDKKMKVISLFSGCGGLDLGFEGGFKSLGKKYEENIFHVVWANDYNGPSCETLKINFPQTQVVHGDIVEVLKSNPNLPKADVVLGGFPCQDFSLAGKRRGWTVKRGKLYLSMVEVVNRVQPKAFVAENVKGLMSWLDGKAIQTIKKDFENAGKGYNVTLKLVNTANYGVPELRERVIIVGIRKDLKKTFEFPEETHSKIGDNGKKKWISLKMALGDLEDDKKHFALTSSGYSKAKMFPGTQGNTITKADKPGPTMRAEHHGNIEFHYSKKRRLSAREAARIQSFPDDFKYYKSTSDAYRQIGNAVPPVMGWHIAQQLQKTIS